MEKMRNLTFPLGNTIIENHHLRSISRTEYPSSRFLR